MKGIIGVICSCALIIKAAVSSLRCFYIGYRNERAGAVTIRKSRQPY